MTPTCLAKNRFDVTATQPSTSQRTFSVFCWSRNADPTRLVKNGIIANNLVSKGVTRIIQCALVESVTITGNVIEDTGTPVDSIGISIIGSRHVTIDSNVIESNDITAKLVDGIAIRGDNPSENITISSNAITQAADSGRGIKIQGTTGGGIQHINVVGNTLLYGSSGVGTSSIGIVVVRSAAVTCQDVLIVGNRINAFPRTQIEVDDGGGGDPSNVFILNNYMVGTNTPEGV